MSNALKEVILFPIDVALSHPVWRSGYAQDLWTADLFEVIDDLSVSTIQVWAYMVGLIDDDVVNRQ